MTNRFSALQPDSVAMRSLYGAEFILNQHGELIELNGRAIALLNRARDVALGTSFGDFLKNKVAFRGAFEELLNQQVMEHIEVEFESPSVYRCSFFLRGSLFHTEEKWTQGAIIQVVAPHR